MGLFSLRAVDKSEQYFWSSVLQKISYLKLHSCGFRYFMQSEVNIDHEAQTMEITLNGKVTMQPALKLLEQLVAQQASNENYKRLYIFDDVDFELSVPDFEVVLTRARELLAKPGLKRHRVAFVSSDPFVNHFLNLYRTLGESYSFQEAEVFEQVEPARRWLAE